MTELGARIDGAITADDLIGNTQWETAAGPIDVLITSTGPDETIFMYADVQPRSIVFTLGGGQTITVASLDDVIRMKEATDRFKDHQALPELRRLRTLRRAVSRIVRVGSASGVTEVVLPPSRWRRVTSRDPHPISLACQAPRTWSMVWPMASG